MVIKRLPPIARFLTFQQRKHRFALNVIRDIYPRCFENCWRIVDILHHLLDVSLLTTWEIDHQWSAKRFFIHEPFVKPPMLAHVEPLVAGIYYHCVIEYSMITQIVYDTSYITVNRMNHTQIIVHIPLVFPFCQSMSCQFFIFELLDDRIIIFIPNSALFFVHVLIVGASPFLEHRTRVNLILMVGHFQVVDNIHILCDAHLLLLSSQTTFIVIVKCLGYRVDAVGIELQVASVRIPHTMWSLVMKQQTERFLFVALVLEPIECHVGDDVGHIAFALQPFPIAIELWLVVFALSDEDVPIVESRWVASEMPLPYHSRLIARLLQQFRESLLTTIEGAGVVGESIGVTMFPCKQTCS